MALTKTNLANIVEGTLPVANGGTGSTTTAGAANAILPAQTGNNGKYLTTNGTDTSWGTVTSNPGTVTSVGGTGTVNGITLTGTVTSSGNLTLGGTLGSIANAQLTNSSVTVTAGTGMSGGGAVALGSSVTLTNAGVTSIVAGTGISISGGTGAVTITNTSSVNDSQLAKAWVAFNNSGSILSSYNVSSIGVRGTGQWTVNFSSALADANYAMTSSASPGNTMFNSGGCFCAFQYGPSQNAGAPTSSYAYIYTTQGTYTGGDARTFNPYITSCAFFR